MRSIRFAILLAVGLTLTSLFSEAKAPSNSDDDYDRLDGRGESGMRVNVIEWEQNLEIHVYPAGGLKGLALKVDREQKNKPVMVIGFRFASKPDKQLIRRAVLGIPISDTFKVYRDPSSGSEYDKLVISNNELARPMMAYRLESPPTQLYPEGHPALAKEDGEEGGRKPAKAGKSDKPAIPAGPDQDGNIRPFFAQ